MQFICNCLFKRIRTTAHCLHISCKKIVSKQPWYFMQLCQLQTKFTRCNLITLQPICSWNGNVAIRKQCFTINTSYFVVWNIYIFYSNVENYGTVIRILFWYKGLDLNLVLRCQLLRLIEALNLLRLVSLVV